MIQFIRVLLRPTTTACEEALASDNMIKKIISLIVYWLVVTYCSQDSNEPTRQASSFVTTLFTCYTRTAAAVCANYMMVRDVHTQRGRLRII